MKAQDRQDQQTSADRRTELADERTDLASSRTGLANDRTRLAWWRTGLTAFAVALGVGRLLPELMSKTTLWPFILLGVGFAVYGIALFAYGTRQSRAVNRQLGTDPARKPDRFLTLLAAAGVVLGIGTVLVIVFQ